MNHCDLRQSGLDLTQGLGDTLIVAGLYVHVRVEVWLQARLTELIDLLD